MWRLLRTDLHSDHHSESILNIDMERAISDVEQKICESLVAAFVAEWSWSKHEG